MHAFSFIRRLEDKLRQKPLREKIAQAIYKLNVQRERLEQMALRLHQRDKELFQRCIGAQVSHDQARARIYANECAEIRKIARIVLSSQIALERVILRLQTVEEFGEIVIHMAPIIDVVKETKEKISGVVPRVAGELAEVNSILSDLSLSTGNVPDVNATIEASSKEATVILKETALIAEQRVREKFPELPRFDMPGPALEAEVEVGPNAHAATLEDQVYEYLKSHGGDLNITRCAFDLGASAESVRQALQRLKDQGRIVIHR